MRRRLERGAVRFDEITADSGLVKIGEVDFEKVAVTALIPVVVRRSLLVQNARRWSGLRSVRARA